MASDPRRRRAARPLAGHGLALTGAALGLGLQLPDPRWRIMGQALTAYLLLAGLIVRSLPRHAPPADFGAANTVTLTRATLVCLLAGLIGPQAAGLSGGWLPFTISLTALLLDGADGYLARRLGLASRFGFYFDMETDAVHILVLCALAYSLQKAGAWVLLAGFLRYIFIAAGLILPWLQAPLPPSQRRKTVAVLQTAVLLGCLAPSITRPASAYLAASGLALLTASFAVDILWLLKHSNRGALL